MKRLCLMSPKKAAISKYAGLKNWRGLAVFQRTRKIRENSLCVFIHLLFSYYFSLFYLLFILLLFIIILFGL